MFIISIEEAQAQLPLLIDRVQAGEQFIITRDQQRVATLTACTPTLRKPRQPGSLKGTVLYMAPDFGAPLDEFKEYMP